MAERARGSRQARGYDRNHDRARAVLKASLPGPCGYCGRTVYPDGRWVAAHVVDGDPSQGWMAAHNDCNERAKVRRDRGDGGLARNRASSAVPAPTVSFTYDTLHTSPLVES